MIIKTEHLIIRDFLKKDAAGLLEYLSHPRVNCFVGDRLVFHGDTAHERQY